MSVTTQIEWLNSLDAALAQASQRQTPIYLDFFSPT
jgi:hypothetical protein